MGLWSLSLAATNANFRNAGLFSLALPISAALWSCGCDCMRWTLINLRLISDKTKRFVDVVVIPNPCVRGHLCVCACLFVSVLVVHMHLQLSDALAERNSYRDRYDNVSKKMKKQAAEALDKLSAGFSPSDRFYGRNYSQSACSHSDVTPPRSAFV